jgi:hypothetical protein
MGARQIKREMLVLAGYLCPGEPISAEDEVAALHVVVARICAADKTSGHVPSLLAVMLAFQLDNGSLTPSER